jgi:hypothetical protein
MPHRSLDFATMGQLRSVALLLLALVASAQLAHGTLIHPWEVYHGQFFDELPEELAGLKGTSHRSPKSLPPVARVSPRSGRKPLSSRAKAACNATLGGSTGRESCLC